MDIELKQKIHELLDQKKYPQALQELNGHIEIFQDQEEKDYSLLAEIAGCYISLGNESIDIDSVKKGLSIFQDNREELKTSITEESIDYCLGNAHDGLFRIGIKASENLFPTPEIVHGSLFDAKQSYLKAFKKIDPENLNDLSIQILNNLGNNLNLSGRFVEALQMYDMALIHEPKFPQAIVSKANILRHLETATNCQITISLYAEIYRLYSLAKEQPIPLDEINTIVELGINRSSDFLIANGVELDSLESEFDQNKIEYLSHPQETKFFLDNFMSLTEHGLYCNCLGSSSDDLAIGYPGFITSNEKIAQLELLNNRLKSEFSIARQMYFSYKTTSQTDNVHYENFVDGIENGLNIEKLRTSFRLCFGIFDKIAEGICNLFDLTVGDKENIYFENFWKAHTETERWRTINELKNIHLTALYSIACDLNKKNGEFGFYKAWRNRLEHGLFNITNTDYTEPNWQNELFTESSSVVIFDLKTKHLLQLTRASIFSFVFCVREELKTIKQ